MATEPVLIAAQKGDLKRVNRYLRKGVDINKIFTGHGTILQVAAASGNLALVQFLLLQDKKPDPQLGGGRYDNAIDAARQNGHTEIANLLSRALEEISSGSEVNTEDESSGGSTFPSKLSHGVIAACSTVSNWNRSRIGETAE